MRINLRLWLLWLDIIISDLLWKLHQDLFRFQTQLVVIKLFVYHFCCCDHSALKRIFLCWISRATLPSIWGLYSNLVANLRHFLSKPSLTKSWCRTRKFLKHLLFCLEGRLWKRRTGVGLLRNLELYNRELSTNQKVKKGMTHVKSSITHVKSSITHVKSSIPHLKKKI